jgi:hypothetical protein
MIAVPSTIHGRAQAQAWNGDDGHHWVAHRERYAAMYRQLTARLLAAASIEWGEHGT